MKPYLWEVGSGKNCVRIADPDLRTIFVGLVKGDWGFNFGECLVENNERFDMIVVCGCSCEDWMY